MGILTNKKREMSGGDIEMDNGYYGQDTYEVKSAFDEADDREAENLTKASPKKEASAYASKPQYSMKLVRPVSYAEVPTIADFLLNHNAVVLNLESANKETQVKIFHFFTGVSYAIGGQIKKVAESTYMITPDNVELSEEGEAEVEEEDYSEDNEE